MKKLLTTLLLTLSLSSAVMAQTSGITVKKEGNVYTEVKKIPTVAGLTKNCTKDGSNFITAKGESFPVWKSANGKLFVIRVSGKTGNPYKQYIQE